MASLGYSKSFWDDDGTQTPTPALQQPPPPPPPPPPQQPPGTTPFGMQRYNTTDPTQNPLTNGFQDPGMVHLTGNPQGVPLNNAGAVQPQNPTPYSNSGGGTWQQEGYTSDPNANTRGTPANQAAQYAGPAQTPQAAPAAPAKQPMTPAQNAAILDAWNKSGSASDFVPQMNKFGVSTADVQGALSGQGGYSPTAAADYLGYNGYSADAKSGLLNKANAPATQPAGTQPAATQPGATPLNQQINQQLSGLKNQGDLNKFFATSGYTADQLAQAAPKYGGVADYKNAMAKGTRAYADASSGPTSFGGGGGNGGVVPVGGGNGGVTPGGNFSNAYPSINAPQMSGHFGFSQSGPNTMMAGQYRPAAPQQVAYQQPTAQSNQYQPSINQPQQPAGRNSQALGNALGNWSQLGYKPSWVQ